MQTLSDIISYISTQPDNEKGRLFEILCLYFLKHDTLQQKHFSSAWLWKFWPGNNGKPDTGIDIVAKVCDSESQSAEFCAVHGKSRQNLDTITNPAVCCAVHGNIRQNDENITNPASFCAVQCKFRNDDSAITKSEIDSFLAASSKAQFSERIIFSLTGNFGGHAPETLTGQNPPVKLLTLQHLEASSIDWSAFSFSSPENVSYTAKTLLPHQVKAVDDVMKGFSKHDRGRLIMACGTGKTFTSLKIAERLAGKGGLVLVLVPSISLLNQTLLAWSYDHDQNIPLQSFAVCSDSTVGRYAGDDAYDDMSLSDLAIPPTTDADTLLRKYSPNSEKMTVIFSTYQSLHVFSNAQNHPVGGDVSSNAQSRPVGGDDMSSNAQNRPVGGDVSSNAQSRPVGGDVSSNAQNQPVDGDVSSHAQKKVLPVFDIVICDEAHRTAGVDRLDKTNSGFRKIHDDTFIRSRKRLYMTATPKVYGDDDESKAALKKKAQDKNYVLYDMDDTDIFGPEFHRLTFSQAVDAKLLADYKVMIFMVEKPDGTTPDDFAMFQGVYKALAKDISPIDSDFMEGDSQPMRRAVAFTNTIKNSEYFATHFKLSVPEDSAIVCENEHIDGNTPSAKRSSLLYWLKASPENSCRILSNARCLCEGVDVPALDAVIFLSPKSSEIDIVQSVGRVMRKAEGKQFGYVILPVVISPDEKPEDALDRNDSYKTVWKVLQALRAHDDHFNIEITSMDLNGQPGKHTRVVGGASDHDKDSWFTPELAELYRKEIYIRMVRKCGDKEYWSVWVADFVRAFQEISARIADSLSIPAVKTEFTRFTEELQASINPSVDGKQAVEVLAQHITSKEIFDIMFPGFSEYNSISQAMQKLRKFITAHGIDLEPQGIENFNARVREKAQAARTGEAKQKLLREIYNEFFRKALPAATEKLGIVYTDESIVDFIIRSADWAVRTLLKIPEGLGAKGVHILDPFSGTGTFTARLLDIGVIPSEALERKYSEEIHANDILLLAYYISAANIEAAYNSRTGGIYDEFPGMVLADTFRLNEGGTPVLHRILKTNSDRAYLQEKSDVYVIIGNPPYSVGGKSADYEAVDGRIAKTYAAESTAANKNSLYDSYIRAFRWASDRLKGRGIICYVSNGSYIDSNSADGLRKCLAEEFTHIYVFNLRGNQRGGDWRKEGQKVFGEGSQCPIAITLLVRDGVSRVGKGSPCEIGYYEVGDYLTREEKLAELVRRESFGAMESAGALREIVPNLAGDWVNQRGEEFGGFMNLGNKNEPERDAVFGRRYSRGVVSGHDAYSFNFSREVLCENMRTLNPEEFSEEYVRPALYSPYVKMMTHFSHETNIRVYQMPAIFPKPDTKNLVICVSGIGSNKDFSVLMTDTLPSLTVVATCQCFPLFWYEDVKSTLFGSYTARRDGISDETLTLYRLSCHDGSITKEDIFCWIYGVLSSREYAERFGKDTKRLLARVPVAEELARFRAFRDAGRELGRLHVGYEDVKGYALREEWIGDVRDYTVKKMKVAERRGEKVIRYSERLTIGGIPSEAWEYVVNGRSALEWVVERYSDSVDGKSGLRNDGNAWGRERGDERYIVELIRKVVSVSAETVRILRGMPELGV